MTTPNFLVPRLLGIDKVADKALLGHLTDINNALKLIVQSSTPNIANLTTIYATAMESVEAGEAVSVFTAQRNFIRARDTIFHFNDARQYYIAIASRAAEVGDFIPLQLAGIIPVNYPITIGRWHTWSGAVRRYVWSPNFVYPGICEGSAENYVMNVPIAYAVNSSTLLVPLGG